MYDAMGYIIFPPQVLSSSDIQRQLYLTVISNKNSKGNRILRHLRQLSACLISKTVLRFPPFSGKVENKKCYRSLKLFNIFSSVYRLWHGNYAPEKNMRRDRVLPHNIVSLFQAENLMNEKLNNRISLTRYSITDFLHSFHHVFGKTKGYSIKITGMTFTS